MTQLTRLERYAFSLEKDENGNPAIRMCETINGPWVRYETWNEMRKLYLETNKNIGSLQHENRELRERAAESEKLTESRIEAYHLETERLRQENQKLREEYKALQHELNRAQDTVNTLTKQVLGEKETQVESKKRLAYKALAADVMCKIYVAHGFYTSKEKAIEGCCGQYLSYPYGEPIEVPDDYQY